VSHVAGRVGGVDIQGRRLAEAAQRRRIEARARQGFGRRQGYEQEGLAEAMPAPGQGEVAALIAERDALLAAA